MPNLIDLTKKLGLNEYESKAYLAMVRIGSAQVAAISKSATIPRARVYDVLTSLENKGFVVRKPVKPVEFTPLSPAIAFKNLEKKKKEEFSNHLNELSAIKKSLESQLSLAKISAPAANEVYWVEGRGNIYSKILQQLENSRESVLFSSTQKGLKRKSNTFSNELIALSEKGVKVSFLPSNNSRFVVFDKKAVLLFLSPESVDEKQERALLILSDFVANSFNSTAKKK